MKSEPPAVQRHRAFTILAAGVLLAGGFHPASAQLPSLDQAPFLGYFATYRDGRLTFGIDSQGTLRLIPSDLIKSRDDASITNRYTIEIVPAVIETLPDGRTSPKKLQPASFQTTTQATRKLETCTFRGQTTGGATFEASVSQNRGVIHIGGRLLDPGKLKNPAHFALIVKVPTLISQTSRGKLTAKNGEDDDKRQRRRELKAVREKLERDRVTLRFPDGKSLKQRLADVPDPSITGQKAAVLSGFDLECETHADRRISFNASPGSSISLSKLEATKPWALGFTAEWKPATGPDAQPRLAISVR